MDVTEAAALVDYTAHSIATEDAPEMPSIIPILGTVIPIDYSDGYGDVETMIGELGELHKIAPGEEPPEDSFQELWEKPVKFDEFAKKIRITKRDYAAINGKAKVRSILEAVITSWRRNWATQKEEAFVKMYEYGALSAGHESFNASHKTYTDPKGDKVYDGQAWFSTAHPLGYDSSQTFSNYNASRPFTADNLAQSRREFKKNLGLTDRGRRFIHMPTHVLAPVELEDTVITVLNSRLLPGTAQNSINTNYQTLEPVFSPFIEDTDAWWLARAQFGYEFFDGGDIIVRTYVEQATESIVVEGKGLYGRRIRDVRHAVANNIASS